MRMRLLAATTAAAAFLATDIARAGFVSVGVTDDRTISDTDKNGFADGLYRQSDGYLRTGFSATFWRSALEFHIGSIPEGSSITSATFNFVDHGTSNSGDLNIWGYTGDGQITISDGDRTAQLLGTVQIVASAGVQPFSIDVTSFLRSQITDGSSFVGFLIGANTPSGLGGGASDILSSEGGAFDPARAPRLDVTFEPASSVPEPTSLALVGLGGIGMFGGWYRKRRKIQAMAA